MLNGSWLSFWNNNTIKKNIYWINWLCSVAEECFPWLKRKNSDLYIFIRRRRTAVAALGLGVWLQDINQLRQTLLLKECGYLKSTRFYRIFTCESLIWEHNGLQQKGKISAGNTTLGDKMPRQRILSTKNNHHSGGERCLCTRGKDKLHLLKAVRDLQGMQEGARGRGTRLLAGRKNQLNINIPVPWQSLFYL